MRNNLQEKIKKTLISILNLDSSEIIEGQTQLKDDLGLDSMSSLTFLLALEDNIEGFVVDADNLKMEDLKTLDSITQYVLQSFKSQGAEVYV